MRYYIGLDLKGASLKYALGDGSGKVLVRLTRPSKIENSNENILENLYAAVEKLMEVAEKYDLQVAAVGVGNPGNGDFDAGRIIGPASIIKDLTDASIRERLQKYFHIPVWTDRSANMVAIAEARIGAGRGFNHIVFIKVDMRISGTIILNGRLYRGGSFKAAEIGHISIDYNGKKCRCGGIGCLEMYAAAPAIVNLYRSKLKIEGEDIFEEQLSPEHIFKQANASDSLATETVDTASEALGVGITNIVNLLNPQAVIIGGSVADAGEDYIGRVRKVVFDRALKTSLPGLRILQAELGPDAGVIGAILLAADNTLKLSN